MTKKITFFFILLFFVLFFIMPQTMADDQSKVLEGIYELFQSNFKSLSKFDTVYCEKLLKEILHDLDTKNHCNGDDDCGLINQAPFGVAVPFPKNQITSMTERMKEYCEKCDSGFLHLLENDDLIYEPVCVESKCMVKIRYKKKTEK